MEITALDKVLIDTSVWISFFRKQEPCYETVGGLIDEGRICCCGLILAELLQGAKSTAEQTILADFPVPQQNLWVKSGAGKSPSA